MKTPRRRIILVQPVIPTYRRGFFRRLHQKYGNAFRVYASKRDLGVLSVQSSEERWERPLGGTIGILPGIEWQIGAVSIPVSRGDILVISGAPRSLSNIALLLRARLLGARTVWWGHLWSVTSRDWRARIRWWIGRRADYMLFYTDKEKLEYVKRFGSTHETKVFAINNGLETDAILRLRCPYDATTRAKRILFIGRLTSKANLQVMINALAHPYCDDIMCDIVGDGEGKHSAKQLANQLGVSERIIWHGATTDESRISEIANQCKAFVYPGAVGLSLIHALAYGLPVIVHSTHRGHGPEFAALSTGENGFTFVEGDAGSLARTLSDALSCNERLDRMAIAAAETTRNAFNTASMAERFSTMIETINHKMA